MTYRVYLVSKKEMKRLDKSKPEGLCDPHAGRIYLRRYLLRNPDRLVDTLIHELWHALLDGSGVGYWLEKKGVNQEKLIRFLTPAWVALLRSAKLLEAK